MVKSKQKTLKPLLTPGTAVYSAYWPPETDPHRTSSNPSWYPGTISSYLLSKVPSDERYGYVRYYNIHFDDGDVMDRVSDHFVMDAGEYELHMRCEDDDDDDNNGNGGEGGTGDPRGNKRKKHSYWHGVRNVTDNTSKDLWAKHVGWYVATIINDDGDGDDGNNKNNGGNTTEHTFSLLSDALRAYDASIIRSKGEHTKRHELNLPEEWESYFKAMKQKQSNKNCDNLSSIKDAITTKLTKKHQAEMDRLQDDLQKQHLEEQDVAIKNAISNERRTLREEQSQLKKEMKLQHAREMDKLKKENERLLQEQLGELKLQHERELLEATSSSKNNTKLKLKLQVGEEVYAAWWPDMNRKDTASWYSGHVKSYRELLEEDDHQPNKKAEGRGGGGSYYGPTRVYTIKYDDDGTELEVPEHYVFPKMDYLLSTSEEDENDNNDRCPEWKGVKNITDSTSNDEWAKVVGWYVVTPFGSPLPPAENDDEEGVVVYSRLEEALKAYDASVVKARGDRTKRDQLNLPEDWDWLFGSAATRSTTSSDAESETPPTKMYTEEQLQEMINKEKTKLKRKLDKKYEVEKVGLGRQYEQERDAMLSEAAQVAKDAISKERLSKKKLRQEIKELKIMHEVDKSKAVQNAITKTRKEERKQQKQAQKQTDETMQKRGEVPQGTDMADVIHKAVQIERNVTKIEYEREIQELKEKYEANKAWAIQEALGKTSSASAQVLLEEMQAMERTIRAEVEKEVEIERDVMQTLHMNKLRSELHQKFEMDKAAMKEQFECEKKELSKRNDEELMEVCAELEKIKERQNIEKVERERITNSAKNVLMGKSHGGSAGEGMDEEEDYIHHLQMEKLRGELQCEKEGALRRLRAELQEQYELELASLRALGQKNGGGAKSDKGKDDLGIPSTGGQKRLRRESVSYENLCQLPATKRAKASNEQATADAVAVGSVTPPGAHDDISGKENSIHDENILPPFPNGIHDRKQQPTQQSSQQRKLTPRSNFKDQAAGQLTTEGDGHHNVDQQGVSGYFAADVLKNAAQSIEYERRKKKN